MSAPYSAGAKSGASVTTTGRPPSSAILDKPLSKGKAEINISTFALLFSEMVQVRYEFLKPLEYSILIIN